MTYDETDAARDEFFDNIREEFELEARSFLELDPESNAIDYLENSVRFVVEADNNSMAWKWVVISVFGALYGFCISSLRGSNSNLVKTKDGKLIGFDEAYKRCKKIEYLKAGSPMTKMPLQTTKEQEDARKLIHKGYRNRFEHFPPGYVLIRNLDIAESVGHIYDIIRILVFEVDSMFGRLDNDQREKIRSLCVAGIELSKVVATKLRAQQVKLEKLQG